ncbi:MAG: cytochrome c oxidase subunit II, partial [Acidimicrobiales bacterium]|nr:cytochrome c oxidase subunit II [Acidimicrobiales bacterium]
MSPLTLLRRFRLPALVAAIGLLTGACGGDDVMPQNVLDPQAPIARQLDDLWNPVFAIACVIFVIVQGLVLWVAFRYRRRNDSDSPKQIHGHTGLELGWTITPALILAVVGVATVANIGELDAIPKGNDVMQVRVIGHQWWWEYQYPETGIVTANEMHIPAEAVIDVRITSADVIHSFWPPKLAGKLDAVPGRENHLQIKTKGVKAGEYLGQCAEYCGLSHANMRLKVIVHSPEDFKAWEDGQVDSANLTFADGS